MKQRRFVDFTFDEMTLAVLQREPSLDDLRRKALLLLRGAINLLGRIEIVVDAMSNEFSLDFHQISRSQMAKVATVTIWLDEIDFFSKEETQTANLDSDESTNSEQDLQNGNYQEQS